MRRIFYIPEGHSMDDYKDQWEGQVAEVHSGLSPNIEKYIDDPEVAQFAHIPEFKHMYAPRSQSNSVYFQIAYVDDFADRDNLPQYMLEVWSKNLDRPSDEQIKVDTWIMQYDKGPSLFTTEHKKLDVGWYDLIVVSEEGEEVDSHEISIYEDYDEEE